MAIVQRRLPRTPPHLFAVLANGWRCSGCVAGASHVRAVESSWPTAGSRLHHAGGAWPFVTHDETSVVPGATAKRRPASTPWSSWRATRPDEPLPHERSSTMTAPGPEPDDAPGLEPGGSVQPGDTPPDAGQTSGLSHPQPIPSRTVPIVALVVIGILVLAVAAFFAARAFSLFG